MELLAILSLLFISSASFAQVDNNFSCPTQAVGCMENENPCADKQCPRFASTHCCPEVQEGECVAQFYRTGRRLARPVSDTLCYRNIEYCSDKVCSGRRICEEEVVPCTKPGCDFQAVTAKCVLPVAPVPVVDCEMVKCIGNLECEVFTSRTRTEARCVVSVPTSCTDTVCDEGMVCTMRKRARDGLEVPRCIAENPVTDKPEDCSQLVCGNDLVCEVLGSGFAKCVSIPPPKDCEEVDCGEGMECRPVGNNGRVRCYQVFNGPLSPPTITLPNSTSSIEVPTLRTELQCSDLDCEPGFECFMTANQEKNGDRILRPTCVPDQCPLQRPPRPPRRCEEIRCGRDEECVVCVEVRETRARCQRRSRPTAELPTGRPNGTVERPTGRPTRRPNGTGERPTGRPTRRPNGTGERPTGRPTRRPNGTVERPTGRPTRRPNGTVERPTGRPTGRPNGTVERPTGRPTRRPNGTGERPTGRPTRRPDGTGERPTRVTQPENTRRPPRTCMELECNKMEKCSEFEYRNRTLARCVSPESPLVCDDADCNVDEEVCIELKNEEVSNLAVCLRNRANDTMSGPNQMRAEKCEELDCGRGFECLHSQRNGRGQARCRRAPNRMAMCFEPPRRPNREGPTTVTSTDRPTGSSRPNRPTGSPNPMVTGTMPPRGPRPMLNLPDQCSERECCENDRCYVDTMFENGPPIAFCAPAADDGEPVVFPPVLTCDDLECEEGFQCRYREEEEERPTGTRERPTDTLMGTRERPTDTLMGTRERPVGTRRPTRPTEGGARCVRMRLPGDEGPTRRPMPTGERPTGTRRPMPTGERPTGTRRPMPTGERPTGTRRPMPTGERPTGTRRPMPTGERPMGTRPPMPGTPPVPQ